MNNNDLQKGIQDLKSISLTKTEKRQILRRVFDSQEAFVIQGQASGIWGLFFNHKKLFATIVAVFVVLFSGGGALYASESSVPGDILYEVKVNLVEPVQTALIANPEEKARFETEKATRRLEEAAILVHRNELTESRRIEIEDRFKKHADAVNAIVSTLSATSTEAMDIETEFEARVVANTRVIKKVSEKLERTKRVEVDKFEKKVNDSAVSKNFSNKKKDWKNATNTKPSFDDSTRSIRTVIENTEQKIRTADDIRKKNSKNLKNDSVLEEIREDSERVLENAKKALKNAESKKSNGDERGAREVLEISDRAAHEADASIRGSLKIEKSRSRWNR